MAVFRNLFLVLVPGADPRDGVVHADELSHTAIVPVPTQDAAAEVLRGFGAVDLIELYGGLGLATAAELVSLAPDVPVGVAWPALPPVASAVIFEDPAADPLVARWTFGTTTVVAVRAPADAPAAAARLVAAGAERVELCGGMGTVVAGAVSAVVDVPVAAVLFGVESIAPAMAYRARFEAAWLQRPNS